MTEPSACPDCISDATCIEHLWKLYTQEEKEAAFRVLVILHIQTNVPLWGLAEWFRFTNEAIKGRHLSSGGEWVLRDFKRILKEKHTIS